MFFYSLGSNITTLGSVIFVIFVIFVILRGLYCLCFNLQIHPLNISNYGNSYQMDEGAA